VARRITLALGGFVVLLLGALASMVHFVPADRPNAPPASEQGAPRAAIATDLPNPSSGAMIVPVFGVQRAQLQDNWGESRGGGTREHRALDIPAARGTPVLAAADGTVEKIFESVPGGHTIYVRLRGGDVVHYYAHLDAYAAGLQEGQQVRQGQPIGTVGSSGDASPDAPHLHFEIKTMQPGDRWWQGTNVNPYPLLAGNSSGR